MENNLTIKILDYIKHKNISNTDLARVLGIGKSNLTEWQSGTGKASPRLILKFLFHFDDIDANDFIRNKPFSMVQQNVKNKGYFTQQLDGKGNAVYNVGKSIGTPSGAETEIKYLKEIIAGKDKHIALLEKMLEK